MKSGNEDLTADSVRGEALNNFGHWGHALIRPESHLALLL